MSADPRETEFEYRFSKTRKPGWNAIARHLAGPVREAMQRLLEQSHRFYLSTGNPLFVFTAYDIAWRHRWCNVDVPEWVLEAFGAMSGNLLRGEPAHPGWHQRVAAAIGFPLASGGGRGRSPFVQMQAAYRGYAIAVWIRLHMSETGCTVTDATEYVISESGWQKTVVEEAWSLHGGILPVLTLDDQQLQLDLMRDFI